MLVEAARFFTEADNGLSQSWVTPDGFPTPVVQCNPPGGVKRHGHTQISNQALWLKTMLDLWLAGEFVCGVFVGFQMSPLRLVQGFDSNGRYRVLGRLPICIPRNRMSFWLNTDDLPHWKVIRQAETREAADAAYVELQTFVEKQKSLGLFRQQDGVTLVQSARPTQDNVIIGFPPIHNGAGFCTRFEREFGEKFGDCAMPTVLNVGQIAAYID
jgi:hypothetical protein